MSKTPTEVRTSTITPPVRLILAESKLKQRSEEFIYSSVEETNHERSLSSTSVLSSSPSSHSAVSFCAIQDQDNDSDEESDDEFQLRPSTTIQRMLPRDSLSLSSEDTLIEVLPIFICQICLEESQIRPLSCCLSTVCSSCLHLHLTSNINEAKIRISCPSCPHIFTREEILRLLSENDINGDIAERYKRFFADINHEPHIKTCPQCCAIKQIDKKLVEGMRWKKNIPRHVTCDECLFHWCFFCHAPWHDKMTCKEYQEGEKMLRAWAAKVDNNQQNAQQCPRCKVFISRNGGCPHMICSKCHCDFCYNCGKRRYGIKFLGSHESRYSPFGCKYNLYPDKPILRRTVRGLVAGAATIAAPVAAVGAVAILAVGTTIAAPTYGTYRLVRHIRNKRRARHISRVTRPTSIDESDRDSNINNNDDDDDDDIRRAVQASLITYKEENGRRVEFLDIDSNIVEEL